MEVKNLKIDSRLETNINDGSLKYVSSGKIPQTERKTYTSNLELQSMGKLDTQVSRPCAIIGPDRILPPNSNESYGKTGPEDIWPCPDGYRQLYEHPLKMSEFQPSRNISPRQTFQENMQRIMVPPTFSSIKNSDEPSSKNKLNVPPETKYCDIPYTINTLNNEHKTVRNVDIPVSNINPAFARNISGNGWPGVSVRPLRPYPAPEFYQYSEYSNLAGPRQMPMVRPQRGIHDEPPQVYSDRLYQDANVRFKPYPTIKDRYSQTRYEYINTCGNPYPPPSYPPHKFDIPKSLQNHPYPMYPQAPLKFVDRRLPESMVDGFQRPNPHVNMNSFRNHIPPPYGSIPGTCYQNKPYPYSSDSTKASSLNKLPYDTNNRVYLDLDSRPKMYPENFYYNDHSQLIRGDIVIPGHPMNSVPQHAIYRKDNTLFKGYEYPSHYRNIDQSINSTPRLPLQFSPNAIPISPCDSNASNDTSQTMGALQEDCGYVSQSSTTSLKSFDNGMTNDMYKRQDYQNLTLQQQTHKSELNIKANIPNKKGLNVRQFLQMWNEGDEDADNNKEVTLQNSNEEQLYVLGLVNVPNEELCKYDHLQKLSKLPENIKGYNYIELLNQYEKLVESPNFNVHAKSKEHPTTSKHITQTNKDILPRPLSPLDVEAKISQSVIHKEVGCNFEIKPCSPKLLNVDVATSVHNIIGERIIEKVTNPVLMNVTSVKESIENAVDSIPSSCNLSNKRYLDSMKSNNYNIQDLETNTSVCLASLPQLDNDIELNFPEVNQQFINATKTETCVTKSMELQHHQLAETKSEFLQNHEISAQTSNKESMKLSRYRKVKKNEVAIKESNTTLEDSEKADSPSTIQRIDSVIIKNPDNIKLQSTGCSLLHKNVTTLKDTSNEITESLKYCFSSHSQNTDKSTYNGDLSAVSAIDFSLNKNESISAGDINSNNKYIDCNSELYNLNKKKSDAKSNNLFENSMLNKAINEDFPGTNRSKLYENENKQHTSTTNRENIPNNKETKDNSILLSERNVNICDILNDDSLLNNSSLSNNTIHENLSNNLTDHLLNVIPVDKNVNCEDNTVTLPQMEETVSVILNNTLFTNNTNEVLPNKLEDQACLETKIEENSNTVENVSSNGLDLEKMYKISDSIVSDKSDKSSDFHETIFQRKNDSKPFAQDIVDFEEDLQENETVKDIFVFNDDEKFLVNDNDKKDDLVIMNDECKKKIGNKEDCIILTADKIEKKKVENISEKNENDKSFQEKEDRYELPEEKDENNKRILLKEHGEVNFPQEKEENKENNFLTEKNINSEEKEKIFIHDIKVDTVIAEDNFINSREFPLDNYDKNNSLLCKNYNNEVLPSQCHTKVNENSDILTPSITEEIYKIQKHTSNLLIDSDIDISFEKTVNFGKEKADDSKNNYVSQTNLQILQNDRNSHPTNVSTEVIQNIDFEEFKTMEKDFISIRKVHKQARILDSDNKLANEGTNPLSPSEKSIDNCIHVNAKKKSIFNKTCIKQSKEMFSPWIQKLLLHMEGVYVPVTHSDLVIKNNISSFCIKNENIVNPEITNNLKNIQEEDISQNDFIHNEHKMVTKKNLPSNMLENEGSVVLETSKSYLTPADTPDAIDSLDKIESKILDDKSKIHYSPCNVINSPPKYKAPLSSCDDAITMKRRSLKRSLSESAIGAYSKSDDTDTFFAKRSKIIQADLCSIFQTNRRNSIAEIYNEDNVYILIDDNNYVLTDENDTDKICYTDIVPLNSNIDSDVETIHMVQANDLDGNSESCDSSSTLHNIEEKSFHETWVEDVGCMETIFNDDIAEDIIISAPVSPNSSINSACDTDDTLQCEEVIQHMEKVKDIYGGNMCNIDAQLVETLYRTPQMDVNKTLVNIESPEEIASDEVCLDKKFGTDNDMCKQDPNTAAINNNCNASFNENSDKMTSHKENIEASTVAEVNSEDNTNTHVIIQQELDDYASYSHEPSNNKKCCNTSNRSPKYCISSSSEVTSTTSEDRNSSILLKISNYNNRSPISNINEEDTIIDNKRTSYKLTEINHYKTFNTNYNASGVLITKAAQKYIPPIKETISNLNLKVKLPLPQHSLNKLKQLKKSKVEPKIIKKLPVLSTFNPSDLKTRHDIVKKQKPKFEDVLMDIDKIQLKKRKDARKIKDEIPKVVIKKNESGAHYASSSNVSKKIKYNPDLTGRKWQPWVFLEKDNFIDKMATKNKEKAIFCHRKNSYVLAEKFRKYKSVYNAKFVISQPKPTDVTKGNLKYTIRLKHFY